MPRRIRYATEFLQRQSSEGRLDQMRTIRKLPLSHFTATIVLLAHACSSAPVTTSEATVNSTSTFTPTPRPAEPILTEFAWQAEGTRQVLADTQVALEQNANATATSRALVPQPAMDVEIEVQVRCTLAGIGLLVQRGNRVQIRYLAGELSIWAGADPMTDSSGQAGRVEDCRFMPEANLGGLIERWVKILPFSSAMKRIFLESTQEHCSFR